MYIITKDTRFLLIGFAMFSRFLISFQEGASDPCDEPTTGCDAKYGGCSPSMNPEADEKFSCVCGNGFALDANGKTCNLITTCSEDVATMCDASAVCTPVIDNSTNSASFTCTCKDGFTGDGTAGNCQVNTTCPTEAASLCDANGICTPTVDNSTKGVSFVCSCKDGYTGIGTSGSCTAKPARLHATEETTITTTTKVLNPIRPVIAPVPIPKPVPPPVRIVVPPPPPPKPKVKVPSPAVCMSEETPCNEQGYERPDHDEKAAVYLDRHLVTCRNDNYYLKGFRISRCGEHKFQMKFTCCYIHYIWV